MENYPGFPDVPLFLPQINVNAPILRMPVLPLPVGPGARVAPLFTVTAPLIVLAIAVPLPPPRVPPFTVTAPVPVPDKPPVLFTKSEPALIVVPPV